ncbi:MAG: hypothetical protein Tsb0021_17830 [Chlamydiales bacterium]
MTIKQIIKFLLTRFVLIDKVCYNVANLRDKGLHINMPRNVLFFINTCVVGMIFIFSFMACGYTVARPRSVSISETEPLSRKLPKPQFSQNQEAYDAIAYQLLQLEFGTPTLRLPNLQNFLIYYGTSDRPDVTNDEALLHFALGNGRELGSITAGEKLYLKYDRRMTPPQYVFSPGNRPTPIWIEGIPRDKEVELAVSMEDEEGRVVRDPPEHAHFVLQEREFVRGSGASPWEIGDWRVDGTLLARQRARWFGEDKFLEKHGGEEYSNIAHKQRIDFGEHEGTYSVYLALGETLAWKEGRWVQVIPGRESKGYPLMQVKRLEERIMSFDLWDPDGKAKITLNLLKSKEPWAPQMVQQDFKFVATRTRSQYVFEVKDEKMTLSPHDWLLLTENGWVKLDSEEDIDDYVDRKATGSLFVFDGVAKKDDRNVLIGTLFNPSRTDMQLIELPLPQSNVTVINLPQKSLDSQETYGINVIE